ncbi:putative dyoxygenase (alpha subunit) oxidoreductase protein [Fulvimarina pelagi HTCC2506]|uniref:Putative dyoxygenase (Alpha subunit) oxidoreductase protein n=1 Tax=Fulvimarina pelagi HTCC2506 TaxID=314231 RepID=Q0G132_9HYPH|nr:aromatic ring-hydroxylating dioxygenase subunit alpha [Fulvimarina pelagi]EAU40807.1 putative dyoxygenase (alpha subunit) oxidoreductase protein [Fulvimarina pelagi HTCC2506]
MLQSPKDEVSALLRARQTGHSLPAGLYTRPEAYEADLDVIFHRHWIAVAVEADVPEEGDVYGVDIGRSSIVILRDDAGTVRAFHNVCSHRGAKLVDAGHSTIGKLVCPYHQWIYELDGELIEAPHMGKDFRYDLHHLRPVNMRSIGGILYVCLADEAPSDIETLAEIMAPRLAPYDLANTKVAYESELVEEGNWKLTMENNRECYHCASNHPELCVSFIDLDFGFDPDQLSDEDREEAATHGKMYEERTNAWERDGYPSRAIEHTVGKETNFRTQRLIIAGAGESQTPDALAASKKLLGTMTRKDTGDIHLWGNNSWNHVMADHAVIFTIFPLSADQTLVRTKWLVHKDAVESVDYDLEHLTSVWKATNAQDAALVARAHAGAHSVGYRPGPYSKFTEGALDDFSTWYVERMNAHGY